MLHGLRGHMVHPLECRQCVDCWCGWDCRYVSTWSHCCFVAEKQNEAAALRMCSLALGEQAGEGGPQHAGHGRVQQRQAQRLRSRAPRVEVVPAAAAGIRQQAPPVVVACNDQRSAGSSSLLNRFTES